MNRRPRIQDVATLASVSTATVSLVLAGGRNAEGRVSEATKARVRAAADELGYVPSQAARGLRVGSLETLALILRWADSPWTQQLLRDTSAVADEHGYATVLLSSTNGLGYLGRGSADAAIIGPGQLTPADMDQVRSLTRRGLALAVFSNTLEPDGFDVVRTNEFQACSAAVQRLVEAGHRRIACLSRTFEDPHEHGLSERYDSYKTVLEENGIPLDPALVKEVASSREKAYQASVELLTQPDPPTAIFAASDLAGISAVWAARSLQLRVPDDVTVTGVGNSLEGTQIAPQLTTVGPPSRDFSRIAGRLFERLANPGGVADQIVQETWSIVVRGT